MPPFIDWLTFLARFVPHLDKLDDILDAADKFAKAPDLTSKWVAFKEGGDIVVPILASVTGLAFETEEQACNHVVNLRLGDGKFLERLRKFYDSPLGQLLLELFLSNFLKRPA